MITLREASNQDSLDLDLVYAARNDEAAREVSHSTDPIAPEEHEAWFRRTLSEHPGVLWIAEFDGQAVGYVRSEPTANNRTTISAALLPGAKGKGHGAEAVREIALREVAKGRHPVAHIYPANTVSARAFLAAGFRPTQMIGTKYWLYEWQANGYQHGHPLSQVRREARSWRKGATPPKGMLARIGSFWRGLSA
jgi:RimJ/RimL family protein N-acetyltransferase